jgi:hypothetical protein
LRIEKIKRLAPHLEDVFDIIDTLNQDIEYFKKIRDRSDKKEEKDLTSKICGRLNKFCAWYVKLRGNGLVPELRSINEGLHNYLNGLSVLAMAYRSEIGKSSRLDSSGTN